jgi:capsular exopolysaccharide synthesis family protein
LKPNTEFNPRSPNSEFDDLPLDAGSKFDMREMIHLLLERKWWIISLALMALIVSLIYAFEAKSEFQARSVLQVALSDRNYADVQAAEEMALTRDDFLNTLIATMKNPEVFEKMEAQLGLSLKKDFHEAASTNVLSQSQLNYTLQQVIDVRMRRGTRLIDVTVTHHDRNLAQELANSFAESFIAYNGERKLRYAEAANEGLFREEERLREKLQKSEQELQRYVETELDVNIIEQRALISSKLTSLSTEYSLALSKVKQYEGDLQKVKALIEEGKLSQLLEVPAVREDPAVSAAQENLQLQESLMESVKLRYLEKHPAYQDALSKLGEYKTTRDSLLTSAPLWIESALETAKFRMETIGESISLAQDELKEVDSKAIPYNALERQVQSDKAIYESVLTKLKELDVAKGLDREVITLESKSNGAWQTWPNKPKIIGGGLFAGLALGVGIVFAIGFFDNSLKTVDQAEQFLGLPALGAIPLKQQTDKGEKSGIPGERQVMVNEPNSSSSESIRSLRATINMLGRKEERQVALFTSAIPGEGKSFCSANYAISLAQQGDRTLLIDLDLRRPAIGNEFEMERSTPGVSNYLLDKTPLEELVVRRFEDKLHILTAGPKLPNPAEHLAGPYIAALIKEACEKYDRVVLDTAPLNAVSDTMSLLQYAQVLCLVVRAAKTHRKAVERPLEVMRRSGYSPSGFILNFLPERPGYGGYYYYYYYHGDEYRKGVYGNEEE